MLELSCELLQPATNDLRLVKTFLLETLMEDTHLVEMSNFGIVPERTF